MGCDDHPERLTVVTLDETAGLAVAGCVSGHVVACSGETTVSIKAHRSRITALTISEDGRFAFSAGYDNQLVVTDLAAQRVIARVDAPREIVYDLAYDESAGRLDAFTRGAIHRWRTNTGAIHPVRPLAHQVKRHFDFDDRTFLLPHGLEPVLIEVDARDGTARRLDLPDSRPPAHVRRDGASIYTVDFAGVVSQFEDDPAGVRKLGEWDGDGKNLNTAAFSGSLAAIEHKSPDGATLWNLRTGAKIGSVVGHDAAVFAIAFSTDQRYLATGDSRGRVIVSDVLSSQSVAELREAGASVFDLAFDGADGVVVASADGLSWWRSISDPDAVELDAAHGYRLLAVDTVHRRVAGVRDDAPHIGLWSLESGQQQLEFLSEIGIQNLAFSSDGNTLYWLSSRRMQRLELPPSAELLDVGGIVDATLRDARLERAVLVSSSQ